MLKEDQDFESNSKVFDVLWVLKMTKQIAPDVNTKENQDLTLNDQMLCFLMTR